MRTFGIFCAATTLIACRPPQAKPRSPITLPAAPKVYSLQLPKHDVTTLANGLTVLLVPDDSLPLSTVELLLRTGSIDDPRGFEGLAELTIAAMREGTQLLDAVQISDKAETAGARIGHRVDYELSALACAGRSQHAPLCLQLIGQMVREPSFPQKAIARLRSRMIAETRQARDDPATLAELHFDNKLLGDDHPYGRSITNRSLARLGRERLVQFHARHLHPARAVLVVSGDIDQSSLLPQIKRQLGRWTAATKPLARRRPPAAPSPRGLQVLLVDKPELSQSHFVVGHHGIARADERRDAARVLNHVLSGLRLMKVVRARSGKTYSIRSRFDVATDDGTFLVKSYTRNAELLATLRLVFNELKSIRRQPPTPGEIRAAKGRLAGGYALRFSTTASLARELGEARLLQLSPDHITKMGVRIQQLRPIDIVKSTRLVDADNLAVVIVGPAALVAPQLKQAKIPFETISHLEPISAQQRREARGPEIAAEQLEQARTALRRAARAAGPRPVRLKTAGRLRIQSAVQGMPPMSGRFALDAKPPNQLRIEMDLTAEGTPVRKHTVVQLDKGKATIVVLEAGKQRSPRALPKTRAARLRQALWRQPVFLLHNALGNNVRARLSAKAGNRTTVELYVTNMPPMTLQLDARQRLVQIQYADLSGVDRVTELNDYRRISGVLVPHRVVTRRGNRVQQWTVNSAAAIVGPHGK